MGITANQTENLEAVLAPLWSLIDEAPRYPADTATVFRLCIGAGRAFSRGRMEYAHRVGQLNQPERIAGRFAWSAQDIANALAFCDDKRLWVVGSRQWEKFATPFEKARYKMRNALDYEDYKSRIEQTDWRDLALGILSCAADESRERAEQFFSLLEDRMELHGID